MAGGLAVGVLAAGRWLWLPAAGRHSYDPPTWGLWLVLVVGPLVLGGYYLIQLVRGGSIMALEMRAQCEKCQAALSFDDLAFICSYECTFCAGCAMAMAQCCPNCGGELARRPRRASP